LGDFSYTVAEDLANGQAPPAEAWTTLARLKGQVAELMRDLSEIRAQAARGQFRWTEAQQGAERRLGWLGPIPVENVQAENAQAENAQMVAAPPAEAEADPNLSHSLAELDRELQEVPTLIYDGPFSEQNLRRQPQSDLGAAVSRDEAARRAVDFLTAGDGEARRQRWEAVFRGEARGPIPTYIFDVRPAGRNESAPAVTVEVSKQGGHVITLLDGRAPTAEALSQDAAQRRALDFLRQRGFEGFVPTGWVREGGSITFSLVRSVPRGETAIMLYPELMKVTVDGNGRVIGFDARTYWLNRDPGRKLPASLDGGLSLDDIRARVSPLLEIDRVRPAVIPLPSGQEVFVYEVLASLNGDRFLLYYSAETAREEMILRVVDTEAARLTF
ncbi:MAG TPA: PepSY1/2 domain-containing protein, partial [Bacillota bacterium]